MTHGESSISAARRGLFEDTGVVGTEVIFFARYTSIAGERRDMIDFVVARSAGEPLANGIEFADARFLALDDLPPAVWPATRRRPAEWRGKRVSDGIE